MAGKHAGSEGWVESAVFQRTVDYPDEFEPGYHVVLDGRSSSSGWGKSLIKLLVTYQAYQSLLR